MNLNMHLLRSLMNLRNLFNMVLAVYWTIVLVSSFPAHAGNELGDMEMMKRVGGQSSPIYCQTRRFCTDIGCSTKKCPNPYEECNDPAAKGYFPETCGGSFGNENCTVSGVMTSVKCLDNYKCNCKPEPGGLVSYCIQTTTYKNTTCANIDQGNPQICTNNIACGK